MLTLTNCRYMLMRAMCACSLLSLLLNMVHSNDHQEQRQKHTNHRLWKYKKVLYLSPSPHCQHIHFLRCLRSWVIYFHLREAAKYMLNEQCSNVHQDGKAPSLEGLSSLKETTEQSARIPLSDWPCPPPQVFSWFCASIQSAEWVMYVFCILMEVIF